MTALNKLLQEKLTAKQFFTMPIYLGVTETKFSRLLSGTDTLTPYQIYKIAKLLEIFPYELIVTYEIKNNITINDLEEITIKYENDIKKKANNKQV